MDVFNFAMKMEEDGKAYYTKLATRTSFPGLRTIFTRLAEDEQKHFEIFQQLKISGNALAMEDSEILTTSRNIFADLPRDTKTRKDLQDDLAAYQYAMKIEAESFQLYENAAAKEQNQAVKNLLLKIAAEERKHYDILENIYHFINAPSQYLAWGEFSNLSEFKQFGRDVDD